ncbi:hypothetical protein Tco_0236000, partial [Tanacetum coccineum]
GSGPVRGQDVAPVVRECTFAGFMKCNPTVFRGTEGAVELRRWFEKNESVFGISECAEGKKVKFFAAILQGPALTWWISKIAIMGLETVNQMPQTEMKQFEKKKCQTKSSFAKPYDVNAPGPSRNSPNHVSFQSPRESVGSNDMVHNYYLEEAKKKAQLQKDKALNTKPSVQQSARLPNIDNGNKPKPKNFNQQPRNWPPSMSSRKKDAQSHKTTKRYMPVEKTCDSKKHDRQILIGQKFSPNKSSNVYLKTTPPRSGLTWKPTGRNFTQVGLKWIPIRKLVELVETRLQQQMIVLHH